MKHDAERWHRERGHNPGDKYISNGALIAAMIEAGYEPILDGRGPNCGFNVRVVCPAEESPFGLYLLKARPQSGPEEDFVKDARDDLKAGRFPENIATWAELESYLRSRHAIPEAIEAGKNVWRNYQKTNASRP